MVDGTITAERSWCCCWCIDGELVVIRVFVLQVQLLNTVIITVIPAVHREHRMRLIEIHIN